MLPVSHAYTALGNLQKVTPKWISTGQPLCVVKALYLSPLMFVSLLWQVMGLYVVSVVHAGLGWGTWRRSDAAG